MELTLIEFTFRLLLALILSGIVGLEREIRSKSAGLRTNILVGLGSALFALMALYLSQSAADLSIDFARIAAGVITGVGFLGAGTIMHAKGQVHGLTTAATIWFVAAIGLTVAFGLYWQSLIATLFALLVLLVLGAVEEKVEKKVKK